MASAEWKWKLQLGTPEGTGAFDAKAVTAVVRRNIDKLRTCYGATANAIATFTIEPDGHVTDARASGLNDDNHACIVAVLVGLRFAKPADGKPVQVTYPLKYETPIQRTVAPPRAYDDWTLASIAKLAVKGKLAEASVRGPLQRDLASAVSSRFDRCYERGARDLAPRTALVSFAIGSDGSVTAATASGLATPEADECLADATKRLRFAKPTRGEVSVSVQIKFRPGAAASWMTTGR